MMFVTTMNELDWARDKPSTSADGHSQPTVIVSWRSWSADNLPRGFSVFTAFDDDACIARFCPPAVHAIAFRLRSPAVGSRCLDGRCFRDDGNLAYARISLRAVDIEICGLLHVIVEALLLLLIFYLHRGRMLSFQTHFARASFS